MNRLVWSVALLSSLWMLPTREAAALFKTKLPLKKLLDAAPEIYEGRVGKVEADKQRFVVEWTKDLKGATTFGHLYVVLKGLKKADDHDNLFKRIRSGLPLVVFASKERKGTRIFLFTEGSWFSMTTTVPLKKRSAKEPKPKGEAACRFDACEIYLRRTYAGKTKELLALIPDVRKGKRKSPPWNGKLKPGLGPELPPENKPGKKGGNTEGGKPSKK